jgi:hypothetical protein
MKNRFWLVLAVAGVLGSTSPAHADAVVTDGRFTNVYVYPDPDRETWEEHFKNLPANQKPSDWEKFTRQSIDQFTETLMSPGWPSYFSAMAQYGINPPLFFGSYVASQQCVNAAMKDLHNGVMEWTTIRSLSNCHVNGMDPSPQVNLIFSPDIKIGAPALTANGPDICTQSGSHDIAYHAAGLNTPNFAVLPTAPGCAPNFNKLTESFSHEVVETLSDPALFGHGGIGSGNELGDQCQSIDVEWKGYNVQRYRSDKDAICWPLPIPAGSDATIWVLGEGSPKIRFTGDVHELTLDVPERRLVTDAGATAIQIWIQTGSDDLRGGGNATDNADVTLTLAARTSVTRNINFGREWGNGETHIAELALPPGAAAPVKNIRGITLSTHFGGGIGGDNWNVDKVALLVAYPKGSATSEPPVPIVHEWLNASGGPLIRLTGDIHDLVVPVPKHDEGQEVNSLDLIVSTGNDDLRGGSNPGDNCDVTLDLTNGKSIALNNVNAGGDWANWTDHTVRIPIPNGGLRGGEVKSVRLHTGFGGGIGGDNWNVQRIQLKATMK